MVEAEAIQSVVTQGGIQAATAAMREADAGQILGTNTASLREAHRQRHGRPALKQLPFNWNAPDKYVELLNFKMEVTNILQTKAYKLLEEGKVPLLRTG